jgi:hypothetical protein
MPKRGVPARQEGHRRNGQGPVVHQQEGTALMPVPWGSTDEEMYRTAVAKLAEHPETTPGRAVLLAAGLTEEFIDHICADVRDAEQGPLPEFSKPMKDERASFDLSE